MLLQFILLLLLLLLLLPLLPILVSAHHHHDDGKRDQREVHLQPHVSEAATPCVGGCNPMCQRL